MLEAQRVIVLTKMNARVTQAFWYTQWVPSKAEDVTWNGCASNRKLSIYALQHCHDDDLPLYTSACYCLRRCSAFTLTS